MKGEDILQLVDSFENATIARSEWGHREHLIVALHYLSIFPFDDAASRMKRGLLNLLQNGFEVDFGTEMPYHETITLFWLRAIDDYLSTRRHLPVCEIVEEMVKHFDKDFLLRFYSQERVFSDEARTRYIEPDLI